MSSKWFRLISLYGVSVITLLVFVNHLRLRKEGISSWKGGGMGMYAELHPVYNKIFIKPKRPIQGLKPVRPSMKAIKLMEDIQVYPSNAQIVLLKEEYARISGIENLVVEVWTPIYDADLGTFKLKLSKEL